jgi:hypothetical protein
MSATYPFRPEIPAQCGICPEQERMFRTMGNERSLKQIASIPAKRERHTSAPHRRGQQRRQADDPTAADVTDNASAAGMPFWLIGV